MQEERLIELLVNLHDGLSRLGPGNAPSTLRALNMCQGLPAAPDILDVGCGSGSQTLVLASATQGRITATDLFPSFFQTHLQKVALEEGLSERIQTVQADMNDLPFDEEAFDLVWSEGAVYIMGFDNGLTRWRPLVRPGGYLVVSEASWFTDSPPDELWKFWTTHYPGMRNVQANLEAARSLGWTSIGHFHLPVEAWTIDYYGPLRERLPLFRAANADDADAQAVADMTEYEMYLMDSYSEHFGYEFYILRRNA
ncbi:MAG: class I SAM-dependent methyltransferase [Proteobacteria bacterium]|nr:class I SAM-dependent methyltransferase [Pseudomonadota bacterium]